MSSVSGVCPLSRLLEAACPRGCLCLCLAGSRLLVYCLSSVTPCLVSFLLVSWQHVYCLTVFTPRLRFFTLRLRFLAASLLSFLLVLTLSVFTPQLSGCLEV
jgi:hypothetical protein